MEYNQFVAITEDIAKHAEGNKNFLLYFDLVTGERYEGAWEWLVKEKTSHGVIVISPVGDTPPIYMPVATIAYIAVPKR